MVEMSNTQWELVLEKHQVKIDKINDLVQDVKEKNEYIDFLKTERKNLATEASTLASENIRLELENAKLQKESETSTATMSAILQTLNDTLNLMERHGLSTKVQRVQASALDLLA